jgi:hypothetical protein
VPGRNTSVADRRAGPRDETHRADVRRLQRIVALRSLGISLEDRGAPRGRVRPGRPIPPPARRHRRAHPHGRRPTVPVAPAGTAGSCGYGPSRLPHDEGPGAVAPGPRVCEFHYHLPAGSPACLFRTSRLRGRVVRGSLMRDRRPPSLLMGLRCPPDMFALMTGDPTVCNPPLLLLVSYTILSAPAFHLLEPANPVPARATRLVNVPEPVTVIGTGRLTCPASPLACSSSSATPT